jgi:hypothetical protein
VDQLLKLGIGGVQRSYFPFLILGARITPNKPATLTYLQQDDVVHKSMADFNQYKKKCYYKRFYKEKESSRSFQ